MAPKTRRSCKKAAPAAASLKAAKSAAGVQKRRSQKTPGSKSADCQTLRQVARFGLCTLDDESVGRVREALCQQHPEMKDKVRKRSKPKSQGPAKKTNKRGPYKKQRELKPPCLVTDTRTEQLKTLLCLLFGEELIMPIIDQKSRNAGDLMMAQILTKYWSLEHPLPASEIAEFFGQGGRNQRYIPSARFNDINDSLELPYPPRRQEYLGRPDDKLNDQQDQKVSGVYFATPAKLPKTEVLSEMKEEPETEVIKVEQEMDVPCGHQHKMMTDDEYDEEQVKPMLLQSDNTEEVAKHVKKESLKEEDDSKEDSGCCFLAADEDAAASVKSESYCCHNYNDFVAALQREEQLFIAWQSQQCFKMMKSDLIPAGVLPNLCNVKDDEPMDEVDDVEYGDFSSGYTMEGHPLHTLLLDSLFSNEYMNADGPLDVAEFDFDCSGGLVEGNQPHQMIRPSWQSQQLPPKQEAYSWVALQPLATDGHQTTLLEWYQFR